MKRLQRSAVPERRRGTAALLFGLMLPVFLGIVALAADTAVLTLARAQMYTAADSAALAGAQQLIDDARLTGTTVISTEMSHANTYAQTFGQANKVLTAAPIVNTNPENQAGTGDLRIGYLDPTSPTATLDTSDASKSRFNAVQVMLSRSSDHVAPVPTFFGQVMGFNGTTVNVQSTAIAWNYAVNGYRGNGSDGVNLLPIVLDVDTYNAMVGGLTQDNYTWNPSTKTVTNGADGVTESVLYPVRSGSPGNWGTIKVGVSNNSTSTISDQIEFGITPEQMATYPNSTIKLDTSLSPPSITFAGNPGISAGIKPAIEAIIGKPVTIPIYDINGGNGNNAWYRVIEFAVVRILDSNFQGNPKYVIIQPAFVRDSTAVVGAPQSSLTAGGVIRLHLAR